jgi:hypothetical protein
MLQYASLFCQDTAWRFESNEGQQESRSWLILMFPESPTSLLSPSASLVYSPESSLLGDAGFAVSTRQAIK